MYMYMYVHYNVHCTVYVINVHVCVLYMYMYNYVVCCRLLTVRAASRCWMPMRLVWRISHSPLSPRHRSTSTTLPTTLSSIPRTHIPKHWAQVARTGATTYTYRHVHVHVDLYTFSYFTKINVYTPPSSTPPSSTSA